MDRLAASGADLLVLDPVPTVREAREFPMGEVLRRLRRGHLCLAYLNLGQAEDYRQYWGVEWRAPPEGERGSPEFLLAPDPDGWPGNYPVAYWDPEWRRICLSLVDEIAAMGFDGLYLDWVAGYADPRVAAEAAGAGVDPARAMVDLVRAVRERGRSLRPRFSVIAQNAADLGERVPEFYETIDGFAQESVSFHGEAGASWEDPRAADLPLPARGDWSTASQLAGIARFTARGIPVFTLDYASRTANIAKARGISLAAGCVPFVSRTPLSRLP